MKFDSTQSLLQYLRTKFTFSGLEGITGINQRLLQQYASGLKTPGPAQQKKIVDAVHEFGRELLLATE